MSAPLDHFLPQAAANAAPATATLGGTGELLRVVLSLLAVVVMIMVVGWLTRRMQARVRPGGQHLRCVESLSVGVKERILLLEVGSQQVVVGASPSGLRTLLVLEEPLPTTQARAVARSAAGSFRDALARWRQPR